MLRRWFTTGLNSFAAYTCFVSVAAAQPSPKPSSNASTATTATATATATATTELSEPESPLSLPHLLVEDRRHEIPQQRRPHRALLVTGLVILGGSYAASAIVAAESDRAADEKLFLPVVGPWLDLKHRDCGVNPCGNETFHEALLIGDGALQGLGALSLLLSVIIAEPRERPWYAVGSQCFYVTPRLGKLSGLSAAGEF